MTLADEKRDALAGRLFEAMLGTMDLLTLYIGDRLGLYRALAGHGPMTPAELAARTGIHERYAREWLEQQAVSAILDVDAPESRPDDRHYRLPEGHAEVLVDRDSLNYLPWVGRFAAGLPRVMPEILEAFRSGGGVSWAAYGEDARVAQAEQNRPLFLQVLGNEWLPAIRDVHARLSGSSARVADIGCGGGWSSIGIARAYPAVRVDGFDLDEPSIELARSNAEEHGVADRVSFHAEDGADPARTGQYDLVLACEMIHDLAQPIDVLATMRRLLAPGGAAIVVDERVAERFAAPGDELERLFYGFSVLCCLPVGLSEQPSAGTGTVMRPSTLRKYALKAGFRDVETLPIEHDFFRIYRLIV